jgi:peptide-methionine (R)-S-oxide reductase
VNRRELIGMASVGAVVAGLVGYRLLDSGKAETPDAALRVRYSEAEWRRRLSPEVYKILREADTEYPHTSPLLKEKRAGTFACAACDQPLFASSTKYDSGTGWPSFWQALPDATTRHPDFTIARPRTEVRCSTCGGHLCHVFDDGPQPTGLRYCINGLALTFHPAATTLKSKVTGEPT